MLSRTKSSKRVGWRAKSCGGGESVSQSPLKDKAFSTFLDQNPPFEPRPEKSEQRSVSVSSTSGLRRYRLRGGSDAELAGEEEGFEQSRRERKKFEIRFAHLKHILRLDRLRLRGPRGAQDEFVLAAIAQHLRRLAALVARPPPAEALCIA